MNRKIFLSFMLVAFLLLTTLLPASAGEHHTSPLADLTWERLGGPLGGLGYDIRMDPRNPDVMYVSDAWAGVFKSTDGGTTWFPSSEGITSRVGDSGDAIPIFCLSIDPNDPDTLWVGTEGMRGIFRSDDAGQTWVKKDRGIRESEGITFRGFAVEPGNSNVVYAAAEIASWVWAGEGRPGREFDLTKGVVYKTVDGGEQWDAVWRGDNLARYVWIDPRDTNVLYISTGIFDREAANSDPASRVPGGEGVLKSTDGGESWVQVNNGLNNLFVGSLYMHPENPDILLAGTGNNQYYEGSGVYLSEDGGETWEQTLGNIIIESVEFSTLDPNIAYAGGSESVYRSQDGGHTWQMVTDNQWGPPGVRVGFPIDFQLDPENPDRLFANAYGGGNFLSIDGGHSWVEASKGYTGAQVRDIAVDPQNPGQVFAAARSGIFASKNGGSDWAGLGVPPAKVMEWNTVVVSPVDPYHIVAGNNWNAALLVSRDGGRSWTITGAQILNGTNAGWSALTFSPSAPDTLYAGTAGYFSAGSFDENLPAIGLYASYDGGDSWEAINNELSQDAHVQDIVVDPEDPMRVFAASTNKGILYSRTGGGDWSQMAGGAPTEGALSVALNPHNEEVVLAGFNRRGLYRSEDGGNSWANSSSGLNPEAKVTSIVFDPANVDIVYASDKHNGVYVSENAGKTWQALNNGLLSKAVNDLAVSSDGQALYAAIEGGGTYRLSSLDQTYFDEIAPEAAPELAAPPAPAELTTEEVYGNDFESFDLSGWDLQSLWELQNVDDSVVLAGNRHSWASLTIDRWEDSILHFRLYLENESSALHANVRVDGPKRYFIGLNAYGTYLSKQTGGNEFQNDLAIGPGLGMGWHEIEIRAIGDQISVFADGQEMLTYVDGDPMLSGGVAFESLDDGKILLDDVTVLVPVEEAPEPVIEPTAVPEDTLVPDQKETEQSEPSLGEPAGSINWLVALGIGLGLLFLVLVWIFFRRSKGS